ncbi:MAG: hemolysin family protein [Lachnospiraceae bacterium]|nr:hemolysin family protein [Lachnospiraceae bacterium]MDD3797295.1 hemolysin family protein [Lachnospiraceae bacterium]
MASEDAIQICLLIVLLFFSAFFSSAETSMTTVNKIRIKSLAEEGNKKAQILLKIIDQSGKMLSAILIGNNIVNISASSLATTIAIRFFGNTAVGIVTGIMTLLVLVFGEITPKTMATIYSEKIALAYSSIIWYLMRIMTPLIFIVDHLSMLFLKLLHVDPNAGNNAMTEQELRTLVDVSHEDGVIESEERQMIYNVFDFGDAQAKDIMVPRADMVSVSVTDSYETIIQVFREQKFSRLPVYENDKDNIVGIINIKDFLFCEEKDRFQAADVMYEPYFTYEFKKTAELMVEMREKSISLTIVLDEYGAAIGMITLEDLLEELVGEIRDEYDEDEKDLIQKINDREYLIEGSVKLDDINDALGLSLESDDYDSIGGYIIGQLDHLPAEGEAVKTEDGLLLKVDVMEKNRIGKVHLYLPEPV